MLPLELNGAPFSAEGLKSTKSVRVSLRPHALRPVSANVRRSDVAAVTRLRFSYSAFDAGGKEDVDLNRTSE